MDPAYISAFTGLAGVAIGGLTSFTTSWLTQRAQLQDKRRDGERAKREALFIEFISEATRLYGDALTHEKDDVADLVKLYALVAHLRLNSTRKVVSAAEEVMKCIVETYLAPNRTLQDIRNLAKSGDLNFLVSFGDACHIELAGMR